jgi:phosphate starvation-inducible PhoH-like protein
MSRSKRRKTQVISLAEFQHKKPYVNVQPRNENQGRYIRLLQGDEKDIIFATGPAGTGKTVLACHVAVKMLQEKKYRKIVITRPAVSVDEQHGFLPGTLEKKMEPWTRPLFDVFDQYYWKHELTELINEGVIEIAPLAYMRGRTFEHSFIIADEMQNTTLSQMKMILTRIGRDSKLVITGDLEQADRLNDNGLKHFKFKMNGGAYNYIDSVKFDKSEIQRHPAVKEVLDIYGD